MAEEVKIVVRAETQGNGLQTSVDQLDKLTAAGNRATEATQKVKYTPSQKQVERASRFTTERTKSNADALEAHYAKVDAEEKAKKDTAPRRMRASIADAELTLAQARANGSAPTVIAQRERELRERKLASRFMREQGLGEEEALEKAGSMVAAQTAAKARVAEEKTAAKTRVDAEKKATSEMQEQERISKRLTMRLGGAAGTAMLAVGGELLTDYFERQGIENRDKASRALTARQLQIQSGARGTSGEVQAEAWDAQDRLAELQAQAPDLERQKKQGIWHTALMRGAQYGLAGAGIGMVGGGIGAVPAGLIGGGIGLVSGAVEGWFNGDRAVTENKTAQKREADRATAKQALATKKALEEEASLEVDAIHQRSKRTLEGFRAAQIDDLTKGGIEKYRQLFNAGVPKDVAKAAAMEQAQNDLRDKQIRSASSLVDARAGASDIAAAASWSQQSMPGMEALNKTLGGKLDKIIATGNLSLQAVTLDTSFGQ